MVTELGGRAALPIAIEAMQLALQRRSEVVTPDTVPGLAQVGCMHTSHPHACFLLTQEWQLSLCHACLLACKGATAPQEPPASAVLLARRQIKWVPSAQHMSCHV